MRVRQREKGCLEDQRPGEEQIDIEGTRRIPVRAHAPLLRLKRLREHEHGLGRKGGVNRDDRIQKIGSLGVDRCTAPERGDGNDLEVGMLSQPAERALERPSGIAKVCAQPQHPAALHAAFSQRGQPDRARWPGNQRRRSDHARGCGACAFAVPCLSRFRSHGR